MTGTSTRTPTTVASAAPESMPNSEMVTATASSRKFEVPIRHAGPAMACGRRNSRAANYAGAKTP